LNNRLDAAKGEQKTELNSTNTIADASKKDKKKIESVINKFSEEPIASISASPVGGTVPLIVNLTNTGTGKVNKWTFSDGKKANTASNPVHVFETPGVYSVILSSINADGKTATDSIKVEVTGNSSITSIPTEFSPNGDGVLDVFVLQSKNIAHMNAKIFDKKGTVVYKSEGIDARWDGNDLQGKKAKEGIYFYLINAEGVDGKKYEQKGSINLTR
jgi:gliding motility-associated-like protein